MNITQINSVFFNGDAVSTLAIQTHKMFNDMGYNSALVADLFSEIDEAEVLAFKDYDTSTVMETIAYLTSRFLRLDNKTYYLKEYLKALVNYNKGKSRNLIENADVRIWHFGAFYPTFQYFHEKDFLFYHGITYPYLSNFTKFGLFSKNMLQATLDMQPRVITHSEFIKQSIMALGFPEHSIRKLPPFTNINIPYQEHTHNKPKFVAYGRYSLNKQIPSMAKFCNESNIEFTHFGDNMQTKEFKEQYKKAMQYASSKVRILPKQPTIDKFLKVANIYVSASLHEGFGRPIIEAYAHSLPVICKDGTAMSEIVKDGVTGYLFNHFDEIPALADRIIHKYKEFSMAAYKESKKYSMAAYKEGLLNIINEKYK
ncbi:MAG: glycosyltransferase family 4 protein [Candidatus Thermoplasmatota archaeon]|nr:glycosyltransferase family 4 protein [Candidatus Thermoplasmatota archaeon]MCL5963101.1 glycosyltransferase family 4 protein [Candidatus Thermoplasmatota archaeon]